MTDAQNPQNPENLSRNPHEELAEGMHETPEELRDDLELARPVWAPARWLFRLAAGVVLLLALFVTVTVLLRAVGVGVTGSVELAAASMIILTVLAVPAVTAADRNFRMELVDLIAGPKALGALERVSTIAQTLVALFVAAAAVLLAFKDLTTGITMLGELAWPRWLLTAPVAAGFLVLTYVLVMRLVHTFSSPARPAGEDAEK